MAKLKNLAYSGSSSWDDAKRELYAWGRFVKRNMHYDTSPTCNLPKLIELGVPIRSGYYDDIAYYLDPRLKQTQRVWGFMPTTARCAIFLYFCMDGEKTFKAKQLGLSPQMFNYFFTKGVEFYEKYKDTDFSRFDC